MFSLGYDNISDAFTYSNPSGEGLMPAKLRENFYKDKADAANKSKL